MRKHVKFILLAGMLIASAACKNPPVADFILSSSTVEVGDTVFFQNCCENAVSLEWDFGDGSSSTEENPFHTYAEEGNYSVTLLATNSDGSDQVAKNISVTYKKGEVSTFKVYSAGLEKNLLGDSPSRDVSIYLPPGYGSSGKNYPVVYLLHGYGGDNMLWFGGGYVSILLQNAMDYMISEGTVQPMMLVSPSSYNRFFGSWYVNSPVTGNWEDYIVQDVVDYVDRNYRTIADPDSRGLAGHSMGGYGTVLYAMKHPDVFGAAYAMSSWGLKFSTDPQNSEFFKTNHAVLHTVSKLEDFNSLADDVAYIWSVGVAMAPDPSSPPLYMEMMFNSQGEFVDSVNQQYMTFNPYDLIDTYKDNLLQLNGLVIECGDADGNYNPNVLFCGKLTSIGIKDTFSSYEGGHNDKIPARMNTIVLPWFSDILVAEK